LPSYFQNVCELDIMCAAAAAAAAICGSSCLACRYNLEKAHFIVDEMICNGFIADTNR
jgi:hypothetical protein